MGSWNWRLSCIDGLDLWHKRVGHAKLIGKAVYLTQESRAGKVVWAGYLHDNIHPAKKPSDRTGWDDLYVTVKYPDGKFRTERVHRWNSIDLRINEAKKELALLQPIQAKVRSIKA